MAHKRKKRRKKHVDRTKYRDYTDSSLENEGVGCHLFFYGIISLFILFICVIGIIEGELELPFFTRYGTQGKFSFSGIPLVLIEVTGALIIIEFFMPVFEYYARKRHFYKRNKTSKKYRSVRKIFKYLAWTFFILAVLGEVFW